MRDERIDLLRFIGLSMIILAHVKIPDIVFQIRNFDVPLMVLISGMSFMLTYKKSSSYGNYFFKRIKRLVIPVWIFLTFYFLAMYIFDNPSSKLPDIKTMLESYLLLGGIGYVWIIRVFLIVAILAPMLYLFNSKIDKDKNFFIIILIALVVWEVLRYLTGSYIKLPIVSQISLVTHYAIPYSIIFLLGMRMINLDKKALLLVAGTAFFIFVSYMALLFLKRGTIVPTQALKYPPSIYYLSYAIFVSFILWTVSYDIAGYARRIKVINLVNFISQNSIWIYLWHIPFINYLQFDWFINKYFVVYFCAVCIVFFQVYTVNKLISKNIFSNGFNKNMKIFLTG